MHLSATLSLSGSISTAITDPPPTPACVLARMDTASNLRRGITVVRRVHSVFVGGYNSLHHCGSRLGSAPNGQEGRAGLRDSKVPRWHRCACLPPKVGVPFPRLATQVGKNRARVRLNNHIFERRKMRRELHAGTTFLYGRGRGTYAGSRTPPAYLPDHPLAKDSHALADPWVHVVHERQRRLHRGKVHSVFGLDSLENRVLRATIKVESHELASRIKARMPAG